METPVLLLVYNRPDQTEQILDRLKTLDVSNVYVSADGPKNTLDLQKTDAVKQVLKKYDRLVQKSRISESNLGCKEGVLAGIDWFFEHVEEGVILEDDCLPSEHFFQFVNDLLGRYRNTQKVTMISGNNPLGSWQTQGGHFFSRIGHIWGWATWKSRWQEFNPNLPELRKFELSNGFEREFGPTDFAQSRTELTRKSLDGKIDTWDYQWNAHLLMSGGLAAIPERNLVENIGFNSNGTNVLEKPSWINNTVSEEGLVLTERSVVVDREYEMEWELVRRANRQANSSSFFFETKGCSNRENLKTLSINSTDFGGGAEKIAGTIHNKLLELGHDSKMLVQTKKSKLESINEISDWKAQILGFSPNVIHVHNLHGTSIDLNEFTAVTKNLPVLFTLHDTWLASGSVEHPFQANPAKLNLVSLKTWKKELAIRKEVIRYSNFRFTAPSQWMRELFFNAHRIRPFYVPNAIEFDNSREIEVPSERFILFVANRPETNPYKDFKTLRSAWRKANETLGSKSCDLVVLGGEEYSDKIGDKHIYSFSYRSAEEVRAFMKKSLLVVQASRQDNAPLTILEAHLCGKSVVASMVGGIPELLNDQEKQLLYEPENSSSLAQKLIRGIETSNSTQPTYTSSVDSMVNTYLGHYLSLVNA